MPRMFAAHASSDAARAARRPSRKYRCATPASPASKCIQPASCAQIRHRAEQPLPHLRSSTPSTGPDPARPAARSSRTAGSACRRPAGRPAGAGRRCARRAGPSSAAAPARCPSRPGSGWGSAPARPSRLSPAGFRSTVGSRAAPRRPAGPYRPAGAACRRRYQTASRPSCASAWCAGSPLDPARACRPSPAGRAAPRAAPRRSAAPARTAGSHGGSSGTACSGGSCSAPGRAAPGARSPHGPADGFPFGFGQDFVQRISFAAHPGFAFRYCPVGSRSPDFGPRCPVTGPYGRVHNLHAAIARPH